MGQLGFHVQFEGLIADVEPSGFAWQAGLRQGSRLVEVCLLTLFAKRAKKVAADWYRTSYWSVIVMQFEVAFRIV